jgi:hypothetical protein
MATRSIAICAVALWACGGGGISVEDYLGQKAAADTNALVCELGIAPEYASVLAEAFQQGFPDLLLTPIKREQLQRAVASGRAKYDGRKAKTCLDKMPYRNPGNCWGPSASVDFKVRLRAVFRGAPGPSDCTQIFTGTVADGEACVLFRRKPFRDLGVAQQRHWRGSDGDTATFDLGQQIRPRVVTLAHPPADNRASPGTLRDHRQPGPRVALYCRANDLELVVGQFARAEAWIRAGARVFTPLQPKRSAAASAPAQTALTGARTARAA